MNDIEKMTRDFVEGKPLYVGNKLPYFRPSEWSYSDNYQDISSRCKDCYVYVDKPEKQKCVCTITTIMRSGCLCGGE